MQEPSFDSGDEDDHIVNLDGDFELEPELEPLDYESGDDEIAVTDISDDEDVTQEDIDALLLETDEEDETHEENSKNTKSSVVCFDTPRVQISELPRTHYRFAGQVRRKGLLQK